LLERACQTVVPDEALFFSSYFLCEKSVTHSMTRKTLKK